MSLNISTKTVVYSFILMGYMLLLACKTRTLTSNSADSKNVEKHAKQPTAYPTEPGTCIIQGYIIHVLPLDKSDTDEPCKSFPCKASIIITKSRSCGFGVQQQPSAGDTLEVKFIHSIAASEELKKVYPSKVMLPGLKLDQLFEAQIRIKLVPGDKLLYEISNYELLR